MTYIERLNRLVNAHNQMNKILRPTNATLFQLLVERSADTWQNRICARLVAITLAYARQCDQMRGE